LPFITASERESEEKKRKRLLEANPLPSSERKKGKWEGKRKVQKKKRGKGRFFTALPSSCCSEPGWERKEKKKEKGEKMTVGRSS